MFKVTRYPRFVFVFYKLTKSCQVPTNPFNFRPQDRTTGSSIATSGLVLALQSTSLLVNLIRTLPDDQILPKWGKGCNRHKNW